MRTSSVISLSRCSQVILSVWIIVVSYSGFVHAAGQWNSIGPYGGTVGALAIDPLDPSILYAATSETIPSRTYYRGGVFRSLDGGASWTPANNGLTDFSVVALVIDPLTPSTLYVATASSVFRSTDRGASWAPVDSGLPYGSVRALAIDPLTPSTLYAGTYGGGVFRSTDRGESWNAANHELPYLDFNSVEVLAIDPQTPATLYAGTEGGGVFRSPDRGGSWVAVNNGFNDLRVSALAIDPQTPSTLYAGTYEGGVFRSPDGGGSWVAVNNGLNDLRVSSLAIDPLNPTLLYVGTAEGGVFRSQDGGDSWVAVNNGVTDLRIHALAIDPLNPSTLYAGTGGSVFRSTNGGDSWSVVYDGNVFLELAIDPLTPSTLYASGDSLVFRSTDGGDSWTSVNNGLPGYRVTALAIDPLNPSTLYVGTTGGVFRSIDRGDTWTPINNGLTDPHQGPETLGVSSLAIDPLNPSILYAGNWSGVFRSTDKGNSWTLINVGLLYRGVNSLAIDPLNPSVLYAGTTEAGVFVYQPVALSSFFFPQIADGAAGTFQFQSTLILVNTDQDSLVRVEFYRTPDGEPMRLTLGRTRSVFEFDLKRGESISLPTPGTGTPQVGYARVLAGEGVGGVVVFRRTDATTGVPLYEAGVPASKELRDFCLFVDSLGARDTGFAVVHPPTDQETAAAEMPDATVSIGLYDRQYNLMAHKTLEPLAPGGHLARYVHELFEDPQVKAQAREMQGILQVESDQPLVAVTVRQHDQPAKEFPQEVPILTTFPVIPGVPGASDPVEAGSFSFFFPQLGDGAAGTLQFQSTLILINIGSDSPVRVELYRTPDGEPMTLTLGELGTGSVFDFELKEGESISLPTPGTGRMQVGYARVTASPGVGGLVVFRRTDLTTGILLYEAGVPASEPLNECSLFVDSLGVRDTGFALAYPRDDGSSPTPRPNANVTLRLYDKQYQLVAENALAPLAPGSHLARYVHELFDDPQVKAQAREMEGILVIASDQPLVAVTVRQNDDPVKDFPQEVPVLTTFPVIPGAPE